MDWATDPIPLPAEVEEIRQRVRRIVVEEVAPRAAEVDREHRFPHEGYQALARDGLAGLTSPTSLGGSGHGTLAYTVAMEEIAAGCGSTSLVYMTQMHCGYPIRLAGSEEQQERYLPGLNCGDLYGSLAVTEPEAGSDISGMRTTARPDGDGYVLDGTKTFITTGDRADVIVVFARTPDAEGNRSVSAFVVEGGTPGLEVGRVLDKLGMRGSSTAELHFGGCRVPAAQRLGEEGSGYELSLRSVTTSRMSAAAQGLGLARGAFEALLGHARAAGWFARGRRDAQDLQFALADLRSRIAAARTLLHAAARRVDEGGGEEPTAVVGMAKATCTDLAVAVASEATDLAGTDGDDVDLGLERYLRDAKVTQIYDGTNQIQRMLVARDIRRTLEETT